MKLRLTSVGIATLVALLALGACDGNDSARALWNDVLKKCAADDLLGPDVLYFGLSNDVGPGAVWRKTQQGGYNLRWRSVDLGFAPSLDPGTLADCKGSAKTTSKVSASLSVASVVPALKADVSADFQTAREITVGVGSWAWDKLVEGPYETALKAKPEGDNVKADLRLADRFVVTRALHVSKLSTTLTFESGTATSLKLKYRTPTFEVGPGLSGQWTSATTLTLSSPAAFYVAGELSPITAGGFAAAGGNLVGPKLHGLDKVSIGVDIR